MDSTSCARDIEALYSITRSRTSYYVVACDEYVEVLYLHSTISSYCTVRTYVRKWAELDLSEILTMDGVHHDVSVVVHSSPDRPGMGLIHGTPSSRHAWALHYPKAL